MKVLGSTSLLRVGIGRNSTRVRHNILRTEKRCSKSVDVILCNNSLSLYVSLCVCVCRITAIIMVTSLGWWTLLSVLASALECSKSDFTHSDSSLNDIVCHPVNVVFTLDTLAS